MQERPASLPFLSWPLSIYPGLSGGLFTLLVRLLVKPQRDELVVSVRDN